MDWRLGCTLLGVQHAAFPLVHGDRLWNALQPTAGPHRRRSPGSDGGLNAAQPVRRYVATRP